MRRRKRWWTHHKILWRRTKCYCRIEYFLLRTTLKQVRWANSLKYWQERCQGKNFEVKDLGVWKSGSAIRCQIPHPEKQERPVSCPKGTNYTASLYSVSEASRGKSLGDEVSEIFWIGFLNLSPAPLTLKINSIALIASKMKRMLRNNVIFSAKLMLNKSTSFPIVYESNPF